MVALIVLLGCSFLVQFAMLLVIDYQKRCIEDLETRPKTLRKLQIEEIQTMIRRLQEIQNENFGIASKDTIMRNILNEYTAVYAEQKRKLDEWKSSSFLN